MVRKQTTPLNNEPKTLAETSLKKILRQQISTWNDAPQHMVSGKHKVKQGDSAAHLWEWPKPRHWQCPVLGRGGGGEPQESLVAGGDADGAESLEDGLTVLTELNVISLCNPPSILLGIYPNTCPHKNSHMDVYNSFVHNCPKFGSNQEVLQ